MSNNIKANKIFNPKNADFLNKQGKESKERRKKAIEKR
jgi:hypothetical protein